MRILDDRTILELTERGRAAGPAGRSIQLLEAAWPEASPGTIAATSLSARDRALLALRAGLFGAAIRVRESCSHCGEILEDAFTAEALGLGPIEPPFPPAPSGTLSDGSVVRAVSAADAVAIEACGDREQARAALAIRVAPQATEPDEIDGVLEALDPAADVEIAIRCPDCGRPTLRVFDVPAFVWREIEARVPRILREVADLARVFHWSEEDILALPRMRRAFYLAEARQ